MRTLTHPGGPVHFDLDISAADVEIHVEDRDHAEVTLTPLGATDEHTEDLIARTEHTANGSRLVVRVPRSPGGTTVISSGRGVNCVVSGHVGGTIIQSAGSITVVNGKIISGDGVTVVHGGGGLRVVARLPIGSSLAVDTDAADVITHGHLTSLRHHATSGRLTADSTDRLDADASSGDVRANRAEAVEVIVSSGDVVIGQTRQVRATSSSGDIRITDLIGAARLRSSSGDIRVHAVGESTVRATSSSGDITVTANSGVDVATDTKTSSGDVRTPSRAV